MTTTPPGAAEALFFAKVCYDRKLHAASPSRLYAEALQADPKLADDRRAQHPYNAACGSGAWPAAVKAKMILHPAR